jgi:2-deoxy-D-gluconate 3-dehydrogenase
MEGDTLMAAVPVGRLLDLSGRAAIVTGGAVGIGLGIARRLAEAGARVLVADISPRRLDEARALTADAGIAVSFTRADVAEPTDVTAMVERAVAEFSGLDVLVNNAGIFPAIPTMEMPLETFDRILSVNLRGVFLSCQAAAQVMIRQGRGGRIINISSIDALHPSAIGLAAYDASKHGLWGFTKNLALELAPHQIWVNAIAPGGIATPGTTTAASAGASGDLTAMAAAFLARIPMHRMDDVDEIGKVALFLASDMASYMTGSQVVVDGGALLA